MSNKFSPLKLVPFFGSLFLIGFLSLPALAAPPPPPGVNPLGPVAQPPGVNLYGDLLSGGFVNFVTALLRTLLLLGGLFSLVNFILAGYQFMSAAGDPKAVAAAWAKIWQSLIGLIVTVGAFVLAAVFGYILTKDATFILKPQLYGP